MKAGKKVAIYARVSTKDQSVEMQLNDLERYTREGDSPVRERQHIEAP